MVKTPVPYIVVLIVGLASNDLFSDRRDLVGWYLCTRSVMSSLTCYPEFIDNYFSISNFNTIFINTIILSLKSDWMFECILAAYYENCIDQQLCRQTQAHTHHTFTLRIHIKTKTILCRRYSKVIVMDYTVCSVVKSALLPIINPYGKFHFNRNM